MYYIEAAIKIFLTWTSLDGGQCPFERMGSDLSLDNTRLVVFMVVAGVILNFIVLFIVVIAVLTMMSI